MFFAKKLTNLANRAGNACLEEAAIQRKSFEFLIEGTPEDPFSMRLFLPADFYLPSLKPVSGVSPRKRMSVGPRK